MARMGCRPPQWAGLKFFNVYGPNEYHKDGQRSVAVQLFEQISASGRAKLFHRTTRTTKTAASCVTSYGSAIALMSCFGSTTTLRSPASLIAVPARRAVSPILPAPASGRWSARKPLISSTRRIPRAHYQYFTEARMERLRAAGYTQPFTSLEDGVASYVRGYLQTNDPYR